MFFLILKIIEHIFSHSSSDKHFTWICHVSLLIFVFGTDIECDLLLCAFMMTFRQSTHCFDSPTIMETCIEREWMASQCSDFSRCQVLTSSGHAEVGNIWTGTT